ncbi:MAG: S9 family peptidase [Candidatus Pelagibacterales bacterium]|nr:MAG: S9 family peptidase [Pelagibacterales bacterium]
MNIPKLRQQKTIKKCHGISWEDNYAWIHQEGILEVLRDPSKLNPEVRDYLEKNNEYTEYYLKDTKEFQKKLFDEIKGRIKLDDETLPYTDKKYIYWNKTTKETNYAIKLRKKIGSNNIEEYWSGEKEKKKLKAEYFGIGDLEVSNNDEMLAYSLDLKGSEYYTINIRRIVDSKILSEEIKDTSGSITWSIDDKYIFYSKLDKYHRPRKIYRHEIDAPVEKDLLIYEEKDDGFTCGIGITSDEKYYIISTSDHTTSEMYFFSVNEKNPKPNLFKERQKEIKYSIDSWKDNFYIHTNLDAEDYKICKCKHENINKWEDFIPASNGVLIGGFDFLNEWMIRSEMRDALSKLYIKNLNTGKEEELIVDKEKVISPGASLMQKNRNTNKIYFAYHSPKNPGKSYIYDVLTKEKKLVKEDIIPSGHQPDDYIVERLNCDSHDGRKIPLTITRHKKTKLDGSANLLLYAYGSYGASMGPGFSSTRLSLINRNIIWVTAHIRGGMERGMSWWKEGKMLNKKNTFKDYISSAKFLIDKNYTSKGKIIGMGGSAGGLLMGATVNQAPELFLGMIMAVPFVDTLTTNLDHSLPLTVGEFNEFGNAKENKEHFDYIRSYSPYENIKQMDYPHIFITTSLSDNRVLFDEPTKFTAKLRDYKTDKNILLLKTEMKAGHAGKTGRDSAIEEIALDYTFVLKISEKLNT